MGFGESHSVGRISRCAISRCSTWLDRQPDGVADVSCFQMIVYLRLGEGGVSTKQQPDRCRQITLHHRIKDFLPVIGTVDVA